MSDNQNTPVTCEETPCDVTASTPSYASSRSGNLSRGMTNSSMLSSKSMSAKFNPSKSNVNFESSKSSFIKGNSLKSMYVAPFQSSGHSNSISASLNKISASIGLRKPESLAKVTQPKSNSTKSFNEASKSVSAKLTRSKKSFIKGSSLENTYAAPSKSTHSLLKKTSTYVRKPKSPENFTKPDKVSGSKTLSRAKTISLPKNTSKILTPLKSSYVRGNTFDKMYASPSKSSGLKSSKKATGSTNRTSSVQKPSKIKLDGKGRPVVGNSSSVSTPSSTGLAGKVKDSIEIKKNKNLENKRSVGIV